MKDKKAEIIFYCFAGVIIIWLALLVAPYIDDGLIGIIKNLPKDMERPFNIQFCENSVKTILIFLFAYVLGIGIYKATKRNYKKGKEYGSASWGNVKKINKKYMQLPKSNNKILTQNISIGLKSKEHRRNLNTIIVGGSGAGKTRFYAKPNIMQCNSSYVILDPKRRNFKRYRKFIKKRRV